MGAKFRRQQPIGPYIVDLVCLELKLIVEIDGGQHGAPGDKVKDEARTAWLTGNGYQVLRFWNNEVLGDTRSVLERIRQTLEGHPHLSPLPSREREL